MSALEKRLRDLTARLGGDHPYCPDCGGEERIIVIWEGGDDGPTTVTGERCESCGSPNATFIRVVHTEAKAPVPGQPIKPRYLWDS